MEVSLNLNKQSQHNTCIGGCCSIILVLGCVLVFAQKMFILFFTKSFSQDTQMIHADAMNTTSADAFHIEPDQFTLAFSIIDRNDPPLGMDGLAPYINFMYYVEEIDSLGNAIITPIKAAKCLDLYGEEYAED